MEEHMDTTSLRALLRHPLIRLLAVNLAAGAGAAVLLAGGLLALNPAHLRELMFADQAAPVVLALMLFGFVVTFGSAAMGSAIMMLGGKDHPRDSGTPVPAQVKAAARRS